MSRLIAGTKAPWRKFAHVADGKGGCNSVLLEVGDVTPENAFDNPAEAKAFTFEEDAPATPRKGKKG